MEVWCNSLAIAKVSTLRNSLKKFCGPVWFLEIFSVAAALWRCNESDIDKRYEGRVLLEIACACHEQEPSNCRLKIGKKYWYRSFLQNIISETNKYLRWEVVNYTLAVCTFHKFLQLNLTRISSENFHFSCAHIYRVKMLIDHDFCIMRVLELRFDSGRKMRA